MRKKFTKSQWTKLFEFARPYGFEFSEETITYKFEDGIGFDIYGNVFNIDYGYFMAENRTISQIKNIIKGLYSK